MASDLLERATEAADALEAQRYLGSGDAVSLIRELVTALAAAEERWRGAEADRNTARIRVKELETLVCQRLGY